MDIRVSPVERKFVTTTVRMVGKVGYDETRLSYITAWVGGRIDRLYVDYTGIPVRKGDHMVYLYSPELYATQTELLEAIRAAKQMKDNELEFVRETTKATMNAAREKLRLLGLEPEQIEQLERRGTATDHITIYARAGGIVVRMHVQEGSYVQTGAKIYTLADLSHVWVKLDAFESDLQWIRYGQQIEFTTQAYPGEVFAGKVAFIDPVLTPRSRSVKVRVNVPNAHGKLKPGMFVRALVRSRVAAGGRVMAPELAGKWICPMHPGVVKDQAGACDVCEMPLVRTESLGYVPIDEVEAAEPLVVPASAPLVTGRRAVVYVRVPDAGRPTFEGREIVLGPRAGDYYIVRHGLQEGELVVTQGAFKIDSALQIVARPSMMAPGGSGTPTAARLETPASVQAQLRKVQAAAATVEGAIEAGDLGQIRAAFQGVGAALKKVDASRLIGDAALQWKELAMRLENDSVVGSDVQSVEAARRELQTLKEHVAALRSRFGLRPADATMVAGLDAPPAFLKQLAGLVDGYLALQDALAHDKLDAAREAVPKAKRALSAVDMMLLKERAHMAWMRELPSLRKALAQAAEAEDIHGLREAFALLSEELIAVVRAFGLPAGRALHVLRCPMAFNNRGATWLQADKEVRNPYFGASMYHCGEVVERVEGRGSRVEGQREPAAPSKERR